MHHHTLTSVDMPTYTLCGMQWMTRCLVLSTEAGPGLHPPLDLLGLAPVNGSRMASGLTAKGAPGRPPLRVDEGEVNHLPATLASASSSRGPPATAIVTAPTAPAACVAVPLPRAGVRASAPPWPSLPAQSLPRAAAAAAAPIAVPILIAAPALIPGLATRPLSHLASLTLLLPGRCGTPAIRTGAGDHLSSRCWWQCMRYRHGSTWRKVGYG